MNKLDKFSISFFVVIAIFTIGFFIFANKASYVFANNYEKDIFDSRISSIEKVAEIYAEKQKDLFAEDDTTYIKVDDLAKIGYVISSDGVVIDPRDEAKSLNDCKIKLTKTKTNITAKVLV